MVQNSPLTGFRPTFCRRFGRNIERRGSGIDQEVERPLAVDSNPDQKVVGIRQPVRHLERLADLGVAVPLPDPGFWPALATTSTVMTVSTKLATVDESFIMEQFACPGFLQSSPRLQLRLSAHVSGTALRGKNAAALRARAVAGGILTARVLPSENILTPNSCETRS